MRAFVGEVREALDRKSGTGARRWLCVRVPAFREAQDRVGVDVPAFRAAGVDMFNLSDSYFTTQATELATIRDSAPDANHYLEMTHTTATGRALAGSGSSIFRRTTDEQFYTTAHLAYARGAAGVSLFNFAYYREHVMPELGPFHEPPFHVLSRLKDPAWLAEQPQWYFLASVGNKPPISNRPLPVVIKPDGARTFHMDMAPTEHQRRDGLLRLMADHPIDDAEWKIEVNGHALAATDFVRKPLDHPYEGFLGEPNQYACFVCPRAAVVDGRNDIAVRLISGGPAKLMLIDVVLP
jgi:hypothetical protein